MATKKKKEEVKLPETVIDPELSKQLSDLYKVIGDNTRIKILYALSKESLCVSKITEIANISQSLASHQLKVLKDNSLVVSKRVKNNVVYSLADDHIRWIIDIAIAHLTEEVLQ